MDIVEKVARRLYELDGGTNFDNSLYRDRWIKRAAQIVKMVENSGPAKPGTVLNLYPDEQIPDYAVRLTYNWVVTGQDRRYSDKEMSDNWPNAIVVEPVPVDESR